MNKEAKVNIALYGDNGHQIHEVLADHPRARLVAIAGFPREKLPPSLRQNGGIRSCGSLDELLSDPQVEMVSLCSPRRRDQAADAIRALRAGKHVYAEKPCAMEESEIDEILRTAQETGRLFREMAGTAFWQPYYAMRRIVREGRIGRVVQIVAEKSYPYYDGRPQDEDVDGGLIRQCAVHAFRFVEHVAGMRIRAVQSMETNTGNPKGGGLQMAASFILGLEGGGLASIAANYLNPSGTGAWGYETLHILGDKGMVESTRGGGQTRLVIGDRDYGELETGEPGIDYLDAYLQTILGCGAMPLTSEEELSPTRWVLRAKKACVAVGEGL